MNIITKEQLSKGWYGIENAGDYALSVSNKGKYSIDFICSTEDCGAIVLDLDIDPLERGERSSYGDPFVSYGHYVCPACNTEHDIEESNFTW